MKKLYLFLLLLAATVTGQAQTMTTVDGVRYLIEDDHAVIGRQDKTLSGDIVIPPAIEYNGTEYNVTAMVQPTLTDVYASGNVEVEGGAFQDCQITSISLPNSITVVSAGAFAGCQQLSAVSLPEGLTQISAAAFAECTSLKSVSLPATVTDLGSNTEYGYASYAFGNCSNLTEIIIPEKVSVLGLGCFSGAGIKELTIPATVTELAGYSLAIKTLEKLTVNIRDHRQLKYDKELFGRGELLADVTQTDLVVPKGSHDIYQAYEPWKNFKSITEMDGEEVYIEPDQRFVVVDDVKYIIKGTAQTGYYGIIDRQEPSLSGNVVIPEYISYDGMNVPLWTIVEPASVNAIVGGYFETTGGAFQGTQITEISLPGFSRIPPGTFADCSQLEKVTLRAAIDTLGAACFANCTKLAVVDVQESLNHLGCDTDYGYKSYVFGNCTSLKSFTIPSGVERLADGVFKNAGLETLVIPDGVREIADYALELPHLKTLQLMMPDRTHIDVSGYAFGESNDYLKQADLIVPLGSGQDYGEYYPWMNFRSISDHGRPRLVLNGSEFSVPAGFFTHDESGKFNFNAKFKDAAFDGVEYSSGLKMEGSTKLLFSTDVKAYVTIVQSVWSDATVKLDDTELGPNTEGVLPGTGCRYWTVLVEAGDHTITRGSGESGLFSVKLQQLYDETPFEPAYITTRIDGVRYELRTNWVNEETVYTATVGRQNIELEGDIEIPEVVEYDGHHYTVTGIVEPTALDVYSNQVVEIKEGAFQGTAVTGITLPKTIETISNGAFFECRQLASVSLPAGLKKIGTAAFARCENLVELFVPETVTDLGNDTEYGYASYTFGGCTNLKKVNIPTGVTRLAGGIFMDSGLETFLIPASVKVLEPSSFMTKNLREFKLCHQQTDDLSFTESVFRDVDLSQVNLYVPEGATSTFQEVYPWRDFASITEYVDQQDEHQYNAYQVSCDEEIEGEEVPAAAPAFTARAAEANQVVDYIPSGVSLAALRTPEKEGFEFVRWKELPQVMPAKDVKLTAVYVKLLMGDVNADKAVDVEDVVGIVNKILGEPAQNFKAASADVNGDGKIDVEDVVAVVNIILAATSL